MIFGIIWWVLILSVLDVLILGWIIYPHSDRHGELSWWPGRALAWAVITLTALLWVGGFNLPLWVWENPMQAAVDVVVYLLIGFFWSILHWYLWRNSEDQRDRLKEAHSAWLRAQPTPPEQSDLNLFRQSSYYPYGWSRDFPMIASWVLFWPFDVFFYLLGDFLWNTLSTVGHWVHGIYSAIGKGVDKSVLGDH